MPLYKHNDPKINKDFLKLDKSITTINRLINSQVATHLSRGVPKNTLGKDNDLAIDITTGNMYYKEKGKWVAI